MRGERDERESVYITTTSKDRSKGTLCRAMQGITLGYILVSNLHIAPVKMVTCKNIHLKLWDDCAIDVHASIHTCLSRTHRETDRHTHTYAHTSLTSIPENVRPWQVPKELAIPHEGFLEGPTAE